ncbi:HEAT repeat domain-containing protein [Mumia sp. DW29H23]|uniref:HEAT repeat domain-containing protein n=1 Tax=Mumia sp. DW29H23 TaxID=3421241 RepID=UPI003D698D2E
MTAVEEHRAALREMPASEVRAYLSSRSGLPGPRANLELMGAFADVAPEPLVRELAGDDDEYLRCCGTVGLGRLLGERSADQRSELFAVLHARAADASWRVREAAAMGLQRLGDVDADGLRSVVAVWATDEHPLVRRAAIAGICEPRLLRDESTARAALDACAEATSSLAAVPASQRRDRDVRTLRKALGYCWSVAVAALPDEGLPRFAALAGSTDPDVAWVVRENRGKARLRRLLE